MVFLIRVISVNLNRFFVSKITVDEIIGGETCAVTFDEDMFHHFGLRVIKKHFKNAHFWQVNIVRGLVACHDG